MLSDYSILEEAGTFIVEWARPTLPIEIKAIALLLLAILPFLYIFRDPFARFADRHLHIHWSPKTFGVLAPAISLACATLLLFVKEPGGMIFWNLDATKVSVKSPNGSAAMNWDDVDSAVFNEKSPEKSTLVLKTKNGKELWLILSWLYPVHQEKAIDFINQSTHHRFNLSVDIPDTE
jgi:hypothetical protein